MVNRFASGFRHVRRVITYGAMVVLILVAAFIGIASEFLPWAENNPEKIQAWLSERTGQRIHFSKVEGEWTRRGPRFALQGLRVGEGASTLDVGEADLLVAMYSGVLPGRPLTELKISRLSLRLEQADDGRWAMVGLPGKGTKDPLSQLEGFGELQVERAQLAIVSKRLGWNARLPRVDLRMRVWGGRLRVGASGWIEEGQQPVDAVLDWQRAEDSGLLWIGAKDLALQRWVKAFPWRGVEMEHADADADVWVDVEDRRVSDVRAAVDLQQVRLRSLRASMTGKAAGAVHAVDWPTASLRLRFQQLQDNARLQVARLQIENAQGELSAAPFTVQWGKASAAELPMVPISLLSEVAPLVPALPDALATWLANAKLQGELRDVSVRALPQGAWQGQARLIDAGFAPVARRPGVKGLNGPLRFDAQGGVMRLQGNKVEFTWPGAFREAVDFDLNGTVALGREAQDWVLSSSDLLLRGTDFGLDARAEMRFVPGGGAPLFDLAADLTPSSFSTAKKFWLRDRMSRDAVKWLDGSLVQGKVLDGRVAIGGDLSDWPFRANQGRFDARARVRDAVVRFNPEWPAATAFEADVAFDGPGFEVQGKADLLGNPVEVTQGGIADFAQSVLRLDIRSDSDGASLQQLMRRSPLRKEHQAHLDAARVAGPAQVDLVLDLPLGAQAQRRHETKTMQGTLRLRDADLKDSRWGGVDFREVSGDVAFSDEGFDTGPLQVMMDGRPARFQLKAGDVLGGASLQAQASLDGRLPITSLLRWHSSLDWLPPYADGSSDWRIRIDIPQGHNANAQLSVSSDLVGTRLKLPAPLDKPADMTLPLELKAELQARQTPLQVSLGRLFSMKAIAREDAPLVGRIRFGGAVDEALPLRGLRIDGEVGRLDAAGWLGFASGGDAGPGLQDVDLQVEQLLLLDRAYPETRLQLKRESKGTRIRLEGQHIAGSIEVPDAAGAAVSGRFSRVHLHAFSMTAPAQKGAAPVSASQLPAEIPPGMLTDPARVPPLDFRVDEMRMGDSLLGVAELRTAPMANGLRIERFTTTGKALRIEASGDWVRQGDAAVTRLDMRFGSDDLGRMLAALGFRGKIAGGKTQASLTGQWPGSPAEFSLQRFQGRLKADVGQGRLLEVEPGGSGRILGLVSIAELPRRLTLDFSDFFSKGYAFNYMRGEFLIADGKAVTQRWTVDGPSSDIIFSGATDLHSQTYDQRVEVLPKAGGVLPAIGLLAGGPAGAAVGAVAQAVLHKPLKQATRTVYSLKGPWENPQTEVIEKGPAKKPPAALPSQPAIPAKDAGKVADSAPTDDVTPTPQDL